MKTVEKILKDKRIETIVRYERGKWCAMTKKEYMFEANSRTSTGTLIEILKDLKLIEKVPISMQYD